MIVFTTHSPRSHGDTEKSNYFSDDSTSSECGNMKLKISPTRLFVIFRDIRSLNEFLCSHGKRNFPLKAHSPKMQFVTKTFLIRGFEQARSDDTMNLNRRTNDSFGQSFMKKLAPCLRGESRL